MIGTVWVTIESLVVTAVLVTTATVPFEEELACLFANSTKASATFAFCLCIDSMAVLSSWNTPCLYLSFIFACKTSWRAAGSTLLSKSWNRLSSEAKTGALCLSSVAATMPTLRKLSRSRAKMQCWILDILSDLSVAVFADGFSQMDGI